MKSFAWFVPLGEGIGTRMVCSLSGFKKTFHFLCAATFKRR